MLRFLLLILIALILSACGAGTVPAPRNASYYFEEGEKYFENNLYQDAIEAWEKVRESYYSPQLNTMAELKIAEAHFKSENFPEAAAAYGDFLREHPGHERTAFVLYSLGETWAAQLFSIDRDQTPTRSMIAAFERLIREFPKAPRVAEAKARIEEGRLLLAGHEAYIGHSYLVYGKYSAAANRLGPIPATYPEYPELDRVYFDLGSAHLKGGDKLKAIGAFNELIATYSSSKYIVKAQKLMEELY